MSSSKTLSYIQISLATLIWGIAAVVIKLTLTGIAPDVFLTYRFLLSAVLASIILASTKHDKEYKKITAANLPVIIIYSIFATTLALAPLFYGLERSSVINLSLITLAMPLIISFLGVIVFHDRITKRERFGTKIAILGTFISLILPSLGREKFDLHLSGNFLILIHLISDVISIIILKKLLQKKYSPLTLTNISMIIGAVSFIFLSLLVNKGFAFIFTIFTLPLPIHLGVIFMAFFSGNIAYYLRSKAQKNLEVSQSALFAYSLPIISSILAIILLKETPNLFFFAGGFITIIGIIIAETRKKV